MTIDQISVFVENRQGKLLEVIETLSGDGIDLRAMCLADTSSFGILRLIVDKPVRALRALEGAGYVVQVSKVIPVAIDDEPGGLAKALRILDDNGISLEYTYAFVGHKAKKAYVIFRVEDNDRAIEVLTSNGIKLVSPEEMYEM